MGKVEQGKYIFIYKMVTILTMPLAGLSNKGRTSYEVLILRDAERNWLNLDTAAMILSIFCSLFCLHLNKGVEETRDFHKRSRNSKNRNKVLSPVTVWKHLARTWPLPGRDGLEQEQGEISWSCLGMLKRNRSSLVCINLCIYSHLETYTILVEKLNGVKNS